MKKKFGLQFTVSILLTALLGHAAPLYFPWWSFVITSFIVVIAVPLRPLAAFGSGFSGLFFLWMIHIIFINAANQNLLADKMANILPFNGNVFLLTVISACIGGLLSGIAALSGSYLRKNNAAVVQETYTGNSATNPVLAEQQVQQL